MTCNILLLNKKFGIALTEYEFIRINSREGTTRVLFNASTAAADVANNKGRCLANSGRYRILDIF